MTERHLDKSLEVEKGPNVFVPQRNRKKEVRDSKAEPEIQRDKKREFKEREILQVMPQVEHYAKLIEYYLHN